MDLNQTLVFRGIYTLKTTLERVLRGLFSNPKIVPATWLYNDDPKLTNIRIYRANPGQQVYYPCLIISAGAHDPDIQAFNMEQEVASQKMDSGVWTSSTTTGYVSIPIDIKIYAKKADDRDILTDLLVSMFRVTGRTQSVNLWWNKIHVSGDNTQVDPVDHNPLFTNTITLRMHTDYTQVITVDQALLITKVIEEVTAVNQITP